MRPKTFVLLFAVILLAAAGARDAAGGYLFVTFDYPPLEYAGDQGRPRGVAVEIVRAVMASLGEPVRIEVFPWTRALNMVRGGQADAIFTAYRNPERERFLDYSREVLFAQQVYFYRRKGSPVTFDGRLESVAGLTIGVLSTISYGHAFDQARHRLDIDKANRLDHSFRKLIDGRIDLVPSDRLVAAYTLDAMGLAGAVERLAPPIEAVPSFIAFTRQRDLRPLRQRFDRELAAMKAGGRYADILRRHGVPQDTP